MASRAWLANDRARSKSMVPVTCSPDPVNLDPDCYYFLSRGLIKYSLPRGRDSSIEPRWTQVRSCGSRHRTEAFGDGAKDGTQGLRLGPFRPAGTPPGVPGVQIEMRPGHPRGHEFLQK